MGNRKPLVSGNWKMNLNHFEAIQLVQKLSYALTKDDVEAVDVSIHPPFTDVRSVQTVLEADKIPISLGAQNCHWEASGAFTGEVAPDMLAKLNVEYVIVGHSERRAIFGETNEMINAKVKAVFKNEMIPILCLGENLEQREAGEAESHVSSELLAGLDGITGEQVSSMVIAYEPVWAIGTGVTASAEQAQEMCALIRQTISKKYKSSVGDSVRIQYGGSVKPGTMPELMQQADIDGALIGGVSLSAEDFAHTIQYRLR
ncbi:MAG: triose-phosphate isomerase [Acidimicrobiales bacterium]|nr:triose-phosphate isomerase [Acidimicrobiales bacterium]